MEFQLLIRENSDEKREKILKKMLLILGIPLIFTIIIEIGGYHNGYKVILEEFLTIYGSLLALELGLLVIF